MRGQEGSDQIIDAQGTNTAESKEDNSDCQEADVLVIGGVGGTITAGPNDKVIANYAGSGLSLTSLFDIPDAITGVQNRIEMVQTADKLIQANLNTLLLDTYIEQTQQSLSALDVDISTKLADIQRETNRLQYEFERANAASAAAAGTLATFVAETLAKLALGGGAGIVLEPAMAVLATTLVEAA